LNEPDRSRRSRADSQSADRSLTVGAALGAEFRALHPEAEPPADNTLDAFFTAVHKLPGGRAALCLSGGGIRSASFALGILQELARRRLLGHFHYLSTVSGGGYIGGWLSAWRHHAQDDAGVFRELSNRVHQIPDEQARDPFAEPTEIQGLRANSNFLTPKLGMMSADTWTIAALCGRNLLLNWIVFGPILLALVLFPRGTTMFLGWAHGWPGWTHYVIVACATVPLALALIVMTANRPLHSHDTAPTSSKLPAPFGTAPFTQPLFLGWILFPTYSSATFLSIVTVRAVPLGSDFEARRILDGIAIGAGLFAISWIVAFVLRRSSGGQVRRFFHDERSNVSPMQELVWWTISGAFGGLIIAGGGEIYRRYAPRGWEWEILATVGVAWSMSALLTADLLFTGLTSYIRRGDQDREWSARSSGWLGVAGLVWLVLAGVALFGPTVLEDIGRWALAATGGVSGLITLMLGAGAKTGATQLERFTGKIQLARILGIAALLFLVCLATFFSAVSGLALQEIETHASLDAAQLRLLLACVSAVVCFSVGAGASYFVNVNRFSLHAVYRNRLIRAFLGSARASVAQGGPSSRDPFTGFNSADNLAMAALAEGIAASGSRAVLFPVVNIALNLVGGANLAWQERKAESFVVTPLHSGSASVGYRPSSKYGDRHNGISLGTAMAISGAAASPNQGYHSSPIIGLIMMLFNVRLGWWLGNPAKRAQIWRRDGPRWSFLPILREMFGRTNDRSNWIYLSDGGHFENLGIYEMMRRRCRFILVSDAGCDPDCTIADLGNALRKAWIDFGVRVDFVRLTIQARQSPPAAGVYCALASVTYPEAPDQPGTLVYIKPGYHGTEPADVRAYAMANPRFPHETTIDQWFSESQMESYRSLGAHILDRICSGGREPSDQDKDVADLAAFAARVRDYLDDGGAKRPNLPP